ncbi:MAG: hypothetical protein ACOX6T_07420, partial [Myxococcales bacterium]
NAHGCSGQLTCNTAGNGTVCDAPSCTNGGLLISELAGCGFSAATPGETEGTNEFIELYNSSNMTVDIGGAALWYRPATGPNAPILLVTFPTGTQVPPRKYLLIGKRPGASGSPGYIGPPAADFIYSAVDMSGSPSAGGQIWLTESALVPSAPSDPHVVDMVGWGSANVFEGSGAAVAHPPTGGSIERKARVTSTGWDGAIDLGSMGPGGGDALAGNGYDSNNNASNFVQRQVRDPQNSQSAAE